MHHDDLCFMYTGAFVLDKILSKCMYGQIHIWGGPFAENLCLKLQLGTENYTSGLMRAGKVPVMLYLLSLYCSILIWSTFLVPVLGAIQSFAGFTDYFAAMAQEGWFPLMCVGLRARWENVHLQDVVDSYGQEWVSIDAQT